MSTIFLIQYQGEQGDFSDATPDPRVLEDRFIAAAAFKAAAGHRRLLQITNNSAANTLTTVELQRV